MYFVPDYTMKLIKGQDFNLEIEKINNRLRKVGVSGYFNTYDNKSLFYEYFLCKNATATIVIVHGLSEFTKKYYELAYYCLNMGYNVFMYDQRGHGLSYRAPKDITLLHVDNYNQYVKDLTHFIDNIVVPVSDKPIYLYSHSMGGAVTVMYLASENCKAQKAVLSAPLFDPVLGYSIPRFIARHGLWVARLFVGGKKRFPGSKDFNPEVKFNKNKDQCEERFNYNLNMRRNNPNYQTTPLSLGWTYSTLGLREKILSKRFMVKIKTPMLLFTANDDTVVENNAHYEFAKGCKICKHKIIKNANHGILNGSSEVMDEHLTATFEFLKD